jgi:hypothetical protein
MRTHMTLTTYTHAFTHTQMLAGAADVAMQALRIDPTHSPSLCSLAYLALNGALSEDPKQQLLEAEKLYRAALMADPTSSVAAAACADIIMRSRWVHPW